jgi:hypothetical protein
MCATESFAVARSAVPRIAVRLKNELYRILTDYFDRLTLIREAPVPPGLQSAPSPGSREPDPFRAVLQQELRTPAASGPRSFRPKQVAAATQNKAIR